MSLLRGQDVKVLLFVNGQPIQTVAPTSFSYKAKQEIYQIQRLGSRYESVDTDGIRGYEGDIEFEMETLALEEFEDAVLQRHLNGDPIEKIIITSTITTPGGVSESWAYPNAILVPSSSVSSRRDGVKKSYKWESEPRYKI